MNDMGVTVSVVSHGQNELVNNLLDDLQKYCGSATQILVTENIPDAAALRSVSFRNARPRGFGANHNAAFRYCKTALFCVCNPDIRLPADPFPLLVQSLGQ